VINEKETIKCEAIFNDERTHRFLWRRVWNKDKPLACVIMLNPCMADGIITDTTTYLVVNNVACLERFGGVEIVNIYSLLTSNLNFRWNSDDDVYMQENDDYIRKSAADCEMIILAWGTGVSTNKLVCARVDQVIAMLKDYADKLVVISDGTFECSEISKT